MNLNINIMFKSLLYTNNELNLNINIKQCLNHCYIQTMNLNININIMFKSLLYTNNELEH